MMVSFGRHGTGSAAAAVAYLLGERDAAGLERGHVAVLRGDPQLVADLDLDGSGDISAEEIRDLSKWFAARLQGAAADERRRIIIHGSGRAQNQRAIWLVFISKWN